jgi:hypothetical protein
MACGSFFRCISGILPLKISTCIQKNSPARNLSATFGGYSFVLRRIFNENQEAFRVFSRDSISGSGFGTGRVCAKLTEQNQPRPAGEH